MKHLPLMVEIIVKMLGNAALKFLRILFNPLKYVLQTYNIAFLPLTLEIPFILSISLIS